ncbi:hypothetical protein ABFA07_000700 [Porites harrisoni]
MQKLIVFIIFFWTADVALLQASTVDSSSPSSNLEPSPSSVDQASNSSSNMSGSPVVQTTMTLNLNASVFENNTSQTTIQPALATTYTQPSQTVNASISATATVALNCADVNWTHSFPLCSDKGCVKENMKILDTMSRCFEEKSENVSFSKMDMPAKLMSMGKGFVKVMKAKLDNCSAGNCNDSEVFVIGKMAMEVGVINCARFNNTKMESMEFPNYKHPAFNGKNMADSIDIPISELPKIGKFMYVVAVMPNVFGVENLKKNDMDWEDSDIGGSKLHELYVVEDKLYTHKQAPKKRINSNLISAWFYHEEAEFKKPALITLKHLHASDENFDSSCVFWDERMWSKDGSSVKTTGPSETICKSFVKPCVKTFAVLSKVAEKVDDSDRKLFVTVATVLGSFSIVSLLICAIVAIVINYHQFDKMRIALNMDVSLLLSQLVFFIGLPTSATLFHSNPKTCEVVNPFLQFFELAALSWLLMEGIYYYSTLKPLFNDNNTVPIVFYFAVGWGIPVAFASACAEFNYPHFGIPERSEFCWMFVRGSEAWYFGAPVLILVVLNLITRACTLKEVITWQDDPDDIRLERAKYRLVTSVVIMLAIVLTWLSGILAVNNTTSKTYHYFFIVFYTFQGLLVLLFYCIRNQEMWEFRKGKKEEEEKEKNKTYDFVYHP